MTGYERVREQVQRACLGCAGVARQDGEGVPVCALEPAIGCAVAVAARAVKQGALKGKDVTAEWIAEHVRAPRSRLTDKLEGVGSDDGIR